MLIVRNDAKCRGHRPLSLHTTNLILFVLVDRAPLVLDLFLLLLSCPDAINAGACAGSLSSLLQMPCMWMIQIFESTTPTTPSSSLGLCKIIHDIIVAGRFFGTSAASSHAHCCAAAASICARCRTAFDCGRKVSAHKCTARCRWKCEQRQAHPPSPAAGITTDASMIGAAFRYFHRLHLRNQSVLDSIRFEDTIVRCRAQMQEFSQVKLNHKDSRAISCQQIIRRDEGPRGSPRQYFQRTLRLD